MTNPDAEGEVLYLQVTEALGGGAGTLSAVVLTQDHVDHSALMPLLFKQAFNGPI